MLTVREALKIRPLNKTKLIAGENGIDRLIKNVTVMEVPNLVQWLKGGEFIVTSFYSFKDNLQEQCNIIKELNRLNASGIAIKTSNYASHIDNEIIELANQLEFPIIKIPNSLTYLDIMTPMNRAIFEFEQHFRLVEEYIKVVIFHMYKNKSSIIERGQTLGYCLEKGYIYTIAIDMDSFDGIPEKHDIISTKDNIYRFLDSILRGYKRKKEILNYMIVRNIEDVTLFIQSKDREGLDNNGKQILKLILEHRKLYYKDMDMTIGISNIGEGIYGIENGYEEAMYAIKLGKVIGKKQNYYFYRNVEIYSLFYKNSSDNLPSVINSTLGKVMNDKELIDTISMYFECNENIVLASNRLFIHKNTLKYRLERIKKITELDVKNIDDKVKLYFGVIAYNILIKKKKIL